MASIHHSWWCPSPCRIFNTSANGDRCSHFTTRARVVALSTWDLEDERKRWGEHGWKINTKSNRSHIFTQMFRCRDCVESAILTRTVTTHSYIPCSLNLFISRVSNSHYTAPVQTPEKYKDTFQRLVWDAKDIQMLLQLLHRQLVF